MATRRGAPPLTSHDREGLTRAQAGEILGLTAGGVTGLIQRGELVSAGRHGPGLGRIRREDVEALAEARAAEQRRKEAEREAVTRERRGLAPGALAPPDRDHEWLSTTEAAVLLGVTRQTVTNRCQRERLPHVLFRGHTWLRRDLLELHLRARRAQASRDAAPDVP